MLIQEVENIVGLTKKSIRYYEDEGLLTPKRIENKYRFYNEDDLKKLKIIKFLRELDVPIRDLKLLNDGSLNLSDCLLDRIKKIESLEKNYQKIKLMCEEIINKKETFNNLDVTPYFECVRVMNKKERFTMNKNKVSKSKKIIGAVIASLVFSSMFIFLLWLLISMQMKAGLPFALFAFILIILLLPIISICYNLVLRIKEIVGGEEDEACKY